MNAVLFDMDGVLVDSVAHKREHWDRLIRDELKLEGIKTAELIGLNVDDKYDYLVEHADLGLERDEFIDRLQVNVERVYTEQIELLPVFESLRDWLDTRGVRVGLVSASSRNRINLVIDRFGLDAVFDAIVSADDISGPSKPDPAIYEHTASLLDLDPSACMTIEDSTHGTRAATDAGMFCLGYRPPGRTDLALRSADQVVTSPEEMESQVKAVVSESQTNCR